MRAADACRFAGIDRSRLNEAIAAGLYSHAPKTIAGKARVFGENDLVALQVFASLVRFGYSKMYADKMTGEIISNGGSCSFNDGNVEICKIKYDLSFLADAAAVAKKEFNARKRRK